MTVHISAIVLPGTHPPAVEWRPWRNCTDRHQTERMAVHSLIRNRGGLSRGEYLRISVASYDDTTPRYPSGRPLKANITEFQINSTK